MLAEGTFDSPRPLLGWFPGTQHHRLRTGLCVEPTRKIGRRVVWAGAGFLGMQYRRIWQPGESDIT